MPDFSTARQLLRSLKRGSGYSHLQKAMVEGWRLRNADRRLLPSFIIIGAQKAGTTSLFHYLQCHPQVLAPSRKEIAFFDGGRQPHDDVYLSKRVDWYRLHFPIPPKRNLAYQTCEATPSYLYSPVAATRIQETLPNARLIAILRDPVKRAISHYQHNVSKGRENLSFSEAIRKEEERLGEKSGHATTLSKNHRHFSYKARGNYYEQLQRYQNFLDQGQLLVLSSDQLLADPQGSIQKVFRFLGLDDKYRPWSIRKHNSSSSRIDVSADDIKLLKQHFSGSNEELFNLIDQRFTW